ncbi:glucoamylase family protein [Limoniibacter endophyticus]|uniref:Glycoamylase-like domain-containing protein n=1 Tax=Limoniibacter endophyticus TaxID=1565040 RepID=A0A8J3GIK6_9HYPH|nr:glucoamylase family protein [Limoniibacter endophyticus]GHC72762.1 hypothetical protein GCM10010136_20700 [Limoniibacter endophyticus]
MHLQLNLDTQLDVIQQRTSSYFLQGAHPVSALPYDRLVIGRRAPNDLVSITGAGFGLLALIVAMERGFIDGGEALNRLDRMLETLEKTQRFHGAFSHFINGTDGSCVRFTRIDDGADLVETTFLLQGLLSMQQYLADRSGTEAARRRIDDLVTGVNWRWFARDEHEALYWHWSPRHGWKIDQRISGWNEALLTYVLAAGAQDHAIEGCTYHEGFARSGGMRNGGTFYDQTLPLGPDFGGPLFFAYYSFCGLDPRGLQDEYARYDDQNVTHARIHYAYACDNPQGYSSYGPGCWGLTACHSSSGYAVASPTNDTGIIAPSAAISSLPYLPEEVLQSLHFYRYYQGGRLWGPYGFVDSFCPHTGWAARTCLAVDQGPIICMIENFRSGLLWELFMSAPQVRRGLKALGFSSPHLE